MINYILPEKHDELYTYFGFWQKSLRCLTIHQPNKLITYNQLINNINYYDEIALLAWFSYKISRYSTVAVQSTYEIIRKRKNISCHSYPSAVPEWITIFEVANIINQLPGLNISTGNVWRQMITGR